MVEQIRLDAGGNALVLGNGAAQTLVVVDPVGDIAAVQGKAAEKKQQNQKAGHENLPIIP